MQYLLSEEEFNKLVSTDAQYEAKQKLQTECTRIADSMYVNIPGTLTMEPAGCVITKQKGICDYCIVKNICPYEWKTFTQS